MIYKYIYYSIKSKYICSYNGTLTCWRYHGNTSLHNPIGDTTDFPYGTLWDC